MSDVTEYPEVDPCIIAFIEADGQDPKVVVPLYDLIAESVVLGAKAKAAGDLPLATIAYGRVSGLFDALTVLGVPVPAESPAAAMRAGDLAVSDPEGFEVAAKARAVELGLA